MYVQKWTNQKHVGRFNPSSKKTQSLWIVIQNMAEAEIVFKKFCCIVRTTNHKRTKNVGSVWYFGPWPASSPLNQHGPTWLHHGWKVLWTASFGLSLSHGDCWFDDFMGAALQLLWHFVAPNNQHMPRLECERATKPGAKRLEKGHSP